MGFIALTPHALERHRDYWSRCRSANALVGFPQDFGIPKEGRPRMLVRVPLGANLVVRTQWRLH